MMLVIETQYRENYGTEQEPYWKFKGGGSYKIENAPADCDVQKVIEAAEAEWSNPYSESYVINWHFEDDGWMSQYEKDQLEYDGGIIFPEPTMNYGELMEFVQ